MRTGFAAVAIGVGLVAMGLACGGPLAGGGGASSGGTSGGGLLGPVSRSGGSSVYDGIDWTTWTIRSGKYKWSLSYDDANATSEWLGSSPAPFSADAETMTVDFEEGKVALRRLDACHMGGPGPHPHEAGKQITYRVERTWPGCSSGACTYGDLPLSTWKIRAAKYKFSLSFDDDGTAFSDWLGTDPATYQLSGDTVTIPFQEGEVTLTRLDNCHWAGTGPHPHEAGGTLQYRVERTWPSCGC